MVNAIRSALELVKHLLPVSTGGPLPLAPRLPDLPSFLDELLPMLRFVTGSAPSASGTPGAAAGSEGEPEGSPEEATHPSGGLNPAPKGIFAEENLRMREEFLGQIERRLARMPREVAAAHLEILRRVLDLLEKRLPPAGESSREAPGSEAPRMQQVLEVIGRGEGLSRPGTGPSKEVEGETARSAEARPAASAHFEAVPVSPPPRREELALAESSPRGGAPPRETSWVSPIRDPGEGRVVETLPGGVAGRTDPEAIRGEVDKGMVKAARLIQPRGASRIRMTLHPPHLGELEVDLSVRDQVLRADFLTQQASAKETILARLTDLEESLRARGIRVGEFRVNVEESARPAPDAGREGVTPSLSGAGFGEFRNDGSADSSRNGPVRGSSIDIVA